MQLNHNAIDEIYRAAIGIEESFEHDFFEIIEAYHEYDYTDESDLPQYRIYIKIKDTATYSENTYTYPIVELAKEYNLFFFDTVTNWREETVTLRFGHDG